MTPTHLSLPRAAAPLPGAGNAAFLQDVNRPEVAPSAGFAGMLSERMQARAADGARAGSRDAFDAPPAAEGGSARTGGWREAAPPQDPARADRPHPAHPDPTADGTRAITRQSPPVEGRQVDPERQAKLRRTSGERAASDRTSGERASHAGDAQRAPAGPTQSTAQGGAEEDSALPDDPSTASQTGVAMNAAAAVDPPAAALVQPEVPASPAPTQALMDWFKRPGIGRPAV